MTMDRFEAVKMLLQPGDIITSKKGILAKDPLIKEGKGMIFHRVKYEGDGMWRIMESQRYPRTFVDMEKIEQEKK